MNAVAESELNSSIPSAAARSMIERLIGFKTVSRDSNLGLIEWARDYLHGFGAVTRLTYDPTGKKANLFATLGDSKKPGLILSGHTDVVPIDGQDWDTDPFVAVERDGKLYARGSADMKGFIGIILAQAPKFAAALRDGRLDAPLHYSLSYDEEVGCIGVRGLIRDLEAHDIRPAGCVVGEPTSMQPIIAHKGMHRFRCAVHGREAHSSYVTHGVNAIEYAARLIVFIRRIADRLAQDETRDYGFTVPYSTLSTGVIHGGIAANIVPKDCMFQFDMRTLPQTSPEALHQEIRAHAQELAHEMQAVDADSGIDLECVSQTVGLAAAETDAIVQWAMQLSRNSQVGKVSYGTEAGLFQKMGVPSVICGPGDIAQAHRPNEFVALGQLAQCERFMDRILEGGFAA
ncbi:MAG TPA: acetylornithine deacetylase [Steroidobacteraceae bacterium]|jgi:acetylornithine deacetylase|nr:acetylornithine deacetylase [Steroidobacteraceae bacterium]